MHQRPKHQNQQVLKSNMCEFPCNWLEEEFPNYDSKSRHNETGFFFLKEGSHGGQQRVENEGTKMIE